VARRGGLGKGLGALIPPGGTEGAGAELGGLDELTLASIKPNRFQPRDHFDEEALSALADSIREVGVLQPVLVRPAGEGEYELIAGERRWRAARRVGLQTIPALVRVTDDASALEQALVENLHRDSLNPLEEAAAYQQLIEDFELTHDEVAARVGRSRATVSNTLRLMQLPPAIQKSLQDGRLSMGHARALLGSPDRAFQEQLAKRIVADDLSVRATEEAVREHQGEGKAPAGTTAEDTAGAPAAGRKLRAPGLVELEELLGDHLDTRVSISMGSSRGKVVVEFSTLEDLERIYRRMTDGASVRQ
jgi:ParB family chromosome partitioning protein